MTETPVRILCMEDDAGLARLLQKRLTRLGFGVDLAADGAADYIIKDATGGFLALIPAVLDRVLNQRRLSERNRQMETELRKVEKLKAIGNMAVSDPALPDHLGSMIRKAETATLQARDLTHQFITFSSTAYPELRPMAAPELVESAARLSLSGGRVNCECRFPPDPWHVVADPGHIRQVINNLVTNAREAMPDGGVVRITGENMVIRPDGDRNRLPLQPGRYLRIDIADQGWGIPNEDLEKVFDPYFSTKERGPQKGMGFGLSTAYFILQKHGGYLSLESEVGAGVTASVYLPAADAAAPRPESGSALPSKRLLLMDDEKMVLQVSGQMLRRLGHSVVFAEDGAEAVDRVTASIRAGTPFDGAILDLTIRDGMGGREAMAEIRRIAPAIRSIVSSGYSEDPVMHDYRNYGFDAALPKPYDKKEMATVLFSVFDS